MRRILLTAFAQLAFVCLTMSQCIENGIFTRPDSAINPQQPAMLNTFDWLKEKYKLNTMAATPGNDSIWSPIYQPDNDIVDHIRLAADMRPQDGWELLRREMGYNHDGTPQKPKARQPIHRYVQQVHRHIKAILCQRFLTKFYLGKDQIAFLQRCTCPKLTA